MAAALLFGWGGRRWLSAPPAEASARPPTAASDGAASAPPTANPSAPPAPPESTLAPASQAAPVAASPATPPTPSRPARTPSPAPPSAGAEPRHPTRSAGHLESSPSGTPSVALARLQLTAEPPAWVEVDATRVGRTPLAALPVTPGRHAIRFENPLLGERLEATVTLGPEGSVRVHADFTSATPQVYVR